MRVAAAMAASSFLLEHPGCSRRWPALYGWSTVFEGSCGSVPVVALGRPWKYSARAKDCPIWRADRRAVALHQAAASLDGNSSWRRPLSQRIRDARDDHE
jgi:hypothetical protein